MQEFRFKRSAGRTQKMRPQHTADYSNAVIASEDYVRLIFCDLAGIRRCRVIPMWRYAEACKQGINVTQAIMSLNAFADSVSPQAGISVVGDVFMYPDGPLQPCPWHLNHKLVHVKFVDRKGRWPCSPRDALNMLLRNIETSHGLSFRFGQEIEFFLLGLAQHGGALPAPVDSTAYAQTLALNSSAQMLDHICADLKSLGITVEQYHAEAGPGQFEVVLSHDLGLAAADKIIFARETIAATAAAHGKTACFLPKPFADQAGSAAHTHLSLWCSKTSKNITATEGDDPRGRQFLAGLLHHLPALYLFLAPSPVSYERIQPKTWSGAFSCWGVEHKEAPLRFCPGLNFDNANIELKGLDNTTNPYLAFAAIVTAGLQGIVHELKLPPPLLVDPTEDISLQRLPESLNKALMAFNSNKAFAAEMESSLGKDLLIAYLGVKQEEVRVADTMTKQTQHEHLLHRY